MNEWCVKEDIIFRFRGIEITYVTHLQHSPHSLVDILLTTKTTRRRQYFLLIFLLNEIHNTMGRLVYKDNKFYICIS